RPAVNDSFDVVTQTNQALGDGLGAAFSSRTGLDLGHGLFLSPDSTGDGSTARLTLFTTQVAIQGIPDTSPEGTPIGLFLGGIRPSDLPRLHFAWSVTKDGDPYNSASGGSTGFTFTPDDNASYDVQLHVGDFFGPLCNVSLPTITVTDVAPNPVVSVTPTSG